MKVFFQLRTLLLPVFIFLTYTANAAVLFQDDLESGNLDKRSNGFGWSGSRGMKGEAPNVSSDISHSGNKSLKFTFLGKPSGEDSWSEQLFDFGKNLSEVYINFYVYYPDGTEGLGAKYVHRDDAGPDNNKFFRIWDEHYTQFNIKAGFSTLPSGSSSYIFPEKGTNGGGTGNFSMPYNNIKIDNSRLGRWMEVRMHIKTDDGSRNGILELYLDGQPAIEVRNVNLHPKDASKNYFKHAYFFGWSGSGFSKTTHVYMDDLIVSDTPISDSPTSAASKPQTPLAVTILKRQ